MLIDHDILDLIIRSILLSALALCWIVIFVRIIGLRAFSKMTAFDFVVTIAIGSLLAGASQATDWPGFIQASIAMISLLCVQYCFAHMRITSDRFERVIQNAPVLLMRDGVFISEALVHTRVSKGDLVAKLREANVLDFNEVRAVVLETTGDISVLHGRELNEMLLDGVQ